MPTCRCSRCNESACRVPGQHTHALGAWPYVGPWFYVSLQELSSALVAYFQARLDVERTLSLVEEEADGGGEDSSSHAVCTFRGACRAAGATAGPAVAALLSNMTEQGEASTAALSLRGQDVS